MDDASLGGGASQGSGASGDTGACGGTAPSRPPSVHTARLVPQPDTANRLSRIQLHVALGLMRAYVHCPLTQA